MILPYLTVPFSFSDPAWQWLQETVKPIAEDYQLNAPNDSALVIPSNDFFLQWHTSTARTELQDFFKKFSLQTGDIQFFIYKKLEKPLKNFKGNPHIDTARSPQDPNADAQDVTFRFNILVYGDENSKMIWWNKTRHDPAIISVKFLRPDGSYSARLQPYGNNNDEKYLAVGSPDFIADNLAVINKRSSFVRTDILHALQWNGNNPRFILSVRFFQPWAMIEKIRNNQLP